MINFLIRSLASQLQLVWKRQRLHPRRWRVSLTSWVIWMSLVSPQSRKTRRSWRIRFLSQRKVTMKHKVLVSFPFPNIFLYNTLLQPNITTRGRSYGVKVRRCPGATWGTCFRSDKAASRPHKHYFMFLYPRTSLPPLYKYGSKGETTSARSVHRFITWKTTPLSLNSGCCHLTLASQLPPLR